MKKYQILSLFILFFIPSLAQNKEDIQAIQGIQQNFAQQAKSWNMGDLTAYVESYVSDGRAQTISRAGVTRGKSNILKQYQVYYNKENMGNLHFDKFTYQRLREDLYFVVGRFNLNYSSNNKKSKDRKGWFSVLMQKTNGTWLILSDHSS